MARNLKIAATLAGLVVTVAAFAAVPIYNYFSPGGGLSGNATTQTLVFGNPSYESGVLDVAHGGTGGTAGPGTGTVTSVAESATTPLCVSGSPITTSGTLALAWCGGLAANQFLATPNGSSGAMSPRAIVGADLPPINLASSANGGVTGVLPVASQANNGAADSGTIGLTAVAGSATTYGRSDSTPSLSQAIAPTWTGAHTWTPAGSTVAQVINKGTTSSAYGSEFVGAATSGTISPILSFSTAAGAGTGASTPGTGDLELFQTYSGGGGGVGNSYVVGKQGLWLTGTSTSPTSNGGMFIDSTGGAQLTGSSSSSDPALTLNVQNASEIPLAIPAAGAAVQPTFGASFRNSTQPGSGVSNSPILSFSNYNNVAGTNDLEIFNYSQTTSGTGYAGVISGRGTGTGASAGGLFIGTGAISAGALPPYGLFINAAGGLSNLSAPTTGLALGISGSTQLGASVTGSALTVIGVAGASFANPAETIQAATTTSQSNGLFLNAGTNSSDLTLQIDNAAATASYLHISGDGGIATGTNADEGVGSINASSLYQANRRVPLMSYGLCAVGGGVNSGAQSQNLASCVNNSAGNYTVTFSTAYTSIAPICTVALFAPTAVGVVYVANETLSTATISSTSNSLSTLQNQSFNIQCVGT